MIDEKTGAPDIRDGLCARYFYLLRIKSFRNFY